MSHPLEVTSYPLTASRATTTITKLEGRRTETGRVRVVQPERPPLTVRQPQNIAERDWVVNTERIHVSRDKIR